jgi:hypothetical protein
VVGGQRHRVEREVREQLGEEEVRAGGAVEEKRVPADPPEAGARRPLAFEDGARVDVVPEAGAGKGGAEASSERDEQGADALVVVRA